GPRTVPVRSSIAGGKAQECSRPPRPSDVRRGGDRPRSCGGAKMRPEVPAGYFWAVHPSLRQLGFFPPLTNQNARNAMLCLRISTRLSLLCAFSGSLSAFAADAQTLPIVKNVEVQPLVAQVRRLIEATDYL